MATIDSGKSTRKGLSIKGRLMVDIYRGQIRVRAWPRKRGKITNPKTLAAMEKFRQANILAKYIAPQLQVVAREAAAGSPLLPRDLLIMSIYGRMFSIALIDGTELYPVAARTDVSQSLDILAQTVGDMIARGPEFWEPVLAGAVGQVLTANGPAAAPSFQPSAGAGGSWVWNKDFGVQGTSSSTSSNTFKGGHVKVHTQVSIAAIAATFTPLVASTYQMIVAEINGAGVIQAIDKSNVIISAESIRRPFFFDINSVLGAGKDYAIMVGRTDGPGTYAFPAHFNGTAHWNLPFTQEAFAVIANVNPVVGSTVSFGTTGAAIGPIGLLASV